MTTQLERLKQDVQNLDIFISEVQSTGNAVLVDKLSRKKNMLTSYIAETQLAVQ